MNGYEFRDESHRFKLRRHQAERGAFTMSTGIAPSANDAQRLNAPEQDARRYDDSQKNARNRTR